MISRSTILILSGWLVAMGTGRMLPVCNELQLFLAGAAGVAAYIGLEVAARRQRRIAAERSSDKAAHKLQREREELERLNKIAAIDHGGMLAAPRKF